MSDLSFNQNLLQLFYFRNKIKLPEDVFSRSEEREIIEEYHEGEEKAWRAKHKESIRRLKQKEAEERSNQLDDRDVFETLDEYEMMEELAEELEQLDIKDDELLAKILAGEQSIPPSKQRVAHNLISSTVVNSAINGLTDNEFASTCFPKSVPDLLTEANNSQDLITQNNHEIVDLLRTYRSKIKEVLKNVKKDDERNVNLFLDLIELKDDIEDDIRKMNDEEEVEYSSDSDEKDSDDETASIEIKPDETKRKVRFSTSLEDVKLIESKSELYENGTSENHTIRIHFNHSDAKFACTKLPEEEETISHPGEIHQMFQNAASVTPPATKSILKNKRKVPESQAMDEKPLKKIFHSEAVVVGDVVERSSVPMTEEEVIHITSKEELPKKISKFKQMRLKVETR